jgi:multidrug resistance efflux pump
MKIDFTWLSTCWSGTKKLFGKARFWIVVLFALLVLLVIYYALANRYTPYTNDAYVQAYVIQVAPQVDGQVIRVYVQENQHVVKGELLFEIDPRPYEHKVRQLEGAQALARQKVAQLESELQAARAEETKVEADAAYAKAVFEQESLIFKKDATTERKFLDAEQKHKAAQALRVKAKAVIRQKEEALLARLGDEHALVAESGAQLATAKLNLDWTKVFAPVNGYVTNLQLQPGSYVQPGRPVLTCIDADNWWIVGNFRETNLEYIAAGQPAAIALRSYPGRVFSGKVQSVGWGVAQGQGIPSGELPAVKNPQEWVPTAQRFQVRLVLDQPAEIPLRVGATGSATIYTSTDHPLNGLAECWQRLVTWFYYLR